MWRKLASFVGAQSIVETHDKQFISAEEKEMLRQGMTQPVRWEQVADKPTAFPPTEHTHSQYATVEQLKALTAPVNGYTKTEADGRYYTKQQVDAKIPSVQATPKQYVNGALKVNLTEVLATVHTNASGVATVFLTEDGTATGKALFKSKPFIVASSENNVTGAHQVNNVEIKSISPDFKCVELNVIRGRMVSLLGLTSTTEFAGAGILVNVIAKGE